MKKNYWSKAINRKLYGQYKIIETDVLALFSIVLIAASIPLLVFMLMLCEFPDGLWFVATAVAYFILQARKR